MVGINAENIHTLDKKFICPLCSLILQHPLQINSCGHRICQSCLHTSKQTPVICPLCQKQTTTDQIVVDRAFMHDMQSLPIICSLCSWNGTLRSYQQDHLQQSHRQVGSLDEVNAHIASKCEQFSCKCLSKNVDYRQQQIMGHELKDHYQSKEHQQYVMSIIEQIKSQMGETQMLRDRKDDENDRNTFEHLNEMLNILASGVLGLKDESIKHTDEMGDYRRNVNNLVENMSKVRSLVEEEGFLLEETKQNTEMLKQAIISLKETGIDNLHHVSCDGTYVWKIRDVQEKINDARSERQTSIYSPPFYSSPTGYKMRARLYLHGDGNARRTHMSLFFVLMRGRNDAVLKFPFNYKVIFCLYDQTPQQRHIIDSFRPDIKSNSFQRPRSEMNIASGIPKFAPLTVIEEKNNRYVRDDTMFIKVMVDFDDIPEELLLSLLKQNPGIPTCIQKRNIQQTDILR